MLTGDPQRPRPGLSSGSPVAVREIDLTQLFQRLHGRGLAEDVLALRYGVVKGLDGPAVIVPPPLGAEQDQDFDLTELVPKSSVELGGFLEVDLRLTVRAHSLLRSCEVVVGVRRPQACAAPSR